MLVIKTFNMVWLLGEPTSRYNLGLLQPGQILAWIISGRISLEYLLIFDFVNIFSRLLLRIKQNTLCIVCSHRLGAPEKLHGRPCQHW